MIKTLDCADGSLRARLTYRPRGRRVASGAPPAAGRRSPAVRRQSQLTSDHQVTLAAGRRKHYPVGDDPPVCLPGPSVTPAARRDTERQGGRASLLAKRTPLSRFNGANSCFRLELLASRNQIYVLDCTQPAGSGTIVAVAVVAAASFWRAGRAGAPSWSAQSGVVVDVVVVANISRMQTG